MTLTLTSPLPVPLFGRTAATVAVTALAIAATAAAGLAHRPSHSGDAVGFTAGRQVIVAGPPGTAATGGSDPSVPSASSVFAAWAGGVEEPCPSF